LFRQGQGQFADVMMNNLRWMHFTVCLKCFNELYNKSNTERELLTRTWVFICIFKKNAFLIPIEIRIRSFELSWYSGHFLGVTAQNQRQLIRFYRLSDPITLHSDNWGDVRMCDSIFWLFLWRIKQTRPCVNYLFKILTFLLLFGVVLTSSGRKKNENKYAEKGAIPLAHIGGRPPKRPT